MFVGLSFGVVVACVVGYGLSYSVLGFNSVDMSGSLFVGWLRLFLGF